MDNLCRLCLTPNDLVWIFDKRIAEPGNMKEVIFITTGVEIKDSDKVTQKVCKKCCQVTIKMFKFRATAIKNDRELKAKFVQTSKKNSHPKPDEDADKNKVPAIYLEDSSSSKPRSPNSGTISKPHRTIKNLLCKYPKLKVPRSCIRSNVDPKISLNQDSVSNWFKKKRERDIGSKKQTELLEKSLLNLANTNSNKSKDVLTESQKICDKNQSDTVIVIDITDSESSPKGTQSESTTARPKVIKRKLSESISDPVLRKRHLSSGSLSSSSTDIEREEMFTKLDVTNKAVTSGNPSSDKVVTSGNLSSDKAVTSGNPNSEVLPRANKSTDITICKVCNAVTYSRKEMKIHSRKHTTCPFCKGRFRTAEAKDLHLGRECPIRSLLQNLPTVPLVKAEEIKLLTTKYSSAFDSIIGSPVGDAIKKEPEYTDKSDYDTIAIDDEVLYISDDDLDILPSSIKPSSIKKTEDLNLHQKAKVNDEKESDKKGNVSTANSYNSKEKVTEETSPHKNNSLQLEITINDDVIFKELNFSESESNFLIKLFKTADNAAELPKPSNNSVVVQGNSDKIYALKNIVPHLKRYKIPIELGYNLKLNVNYDLDPPHPNIPEKHLWNAEDANVQRNMLPKVILSQQPSADLSEHNATYRNNIGHPLEPTTASSISMSRNSGLPVTTPARSSPILNSTTSNVSTNTLQSTNTTLSNCVPNLPKNSVSSDMSHVKQFIVLNPVLPKSTCYPNPYVPNVTVSNYGIHKPTSANRSVSNTTLTNRNIPNPTPGHRSVANTTLTNRVVQSPTPADRNAPKPTVTSQIIKPSSSLADRSAHNSTLGDLRVCNPTLTNQTLENRILPNATLTNNVPSSTSGDNSAAKATLPSYSEACLTLPNRSVPSATLVDCSVPNPTSAGRNRHQSTLDRTVSNPTLNNVPNSTSGNCSVASTMLPSRNVPSSMLADCSVPNSTLAGRNVPNSTLPNSITASNTHMLQQPASGLHKGRQSPATIKTTQTPLYFTNASVMAQADMITQTLISMLNAPIPEKPSEMCLSTMFNIPALNNQPSHSTPQQQINGFVTPHVYSTTNSNTSLNTTKTKLSTNSTARPLNNQTSHSTPQQQINGFVTPHSTTNLNTSLNTTKTNISTTTARPSPTAQPAGPQKTIRVKPPWELYGNVMRN